jgi:3-phenylpropionate/trans-cinnamate dioxygenase ferredoxin component
MIEWFDVGTTDEFTPGNWRLVDFEDIKVIVFNVDGEYYAIQDLCTHDGGSLSDGDIENCEIICPRHGARFNIKTGAVLSPPAYEDLPTFPTRVVGNIIQVGDNRFD